MNEKPTLEIIAPTVEEALAKGLAELGLPAEAVSMEVLDAGTKGLFGLGGRQVRVRLTIKSDEEMGLAEQPVRPASKPDEKPLDQTRSKPAPVSKKESRPKPTPKEPAPSPAAKTANGQDELLDLVEATVSKLLHQMRLQAQVSAQYEESDREDRRSIHVDVRGDDLGVLIGRRSETLNAFQYVASLMVGKEVQQWVQLVVDVEEYRSRRETQLRRMARRMAEQTIKTGRRQTLEPMSSNERRIIHLELRDHPAVTTESVGEEPHRKVTIILKEES